MTGRPVICGCSSAWVEAAEKKSLAVRAVRLACHVASRTVGPLGSGDASVIEVTSSEANASVPSVTAAGSSAATRAQDRLTLADPALAAKEKYPCGSTNANAPVSSALQEGGAAAWLLP
jgi:hypothetical protein